jgi:glycosyltransferase involved in cell wall biosynthesis/SAM-dependent methyltransferase
MKDSLSCWCGNRDLTPFSRDYLRCAECETLVYADMPDAGSLIVRDDERDFYGRTYYERMTRECGFPPLAERARLDLPERCLYWLRALLRYRLPPARALELGCAHGGFVAMMRWAGYEATGLEVSSAVVDLARGAFDVPMLLGTVESQPIAPAGLDIVALMDVIEHLPDPRGTIEHCLKLLRPDGILIVQTPRYREGRSLEEMQAEHDRFLTHLHPDHLFLFSNRALTRLFAEAGAPHVAFEPAIFDFYDTFLVAGRQPLHTFDEAAIAAALTATPGRRQTLAMLDLDTQLRDVAARYRESEADRAARLESMHRLEARIREIEADRKAEHAAFGAERESARQRAEELLGERRSLLRQCDAERGLREQSASVVEQQARQLADLDRRLLESEADRVARLESMNRLEARILEIEADRKAEQAAFGEERESARQRAEELLGENRSLLRQCDAERGLREQSASVVAQQARQLAELNRLLLESEADRAARLENINRLQAIIDEVEADRAARLDNINRLQAAILDIEASRQAERETAREELERIRLQLEDEGQCRRQAEEDRDRLSVELQQERDRLREQVQEHAAFRTQAAGEIERLRLHNEEEQGLRDRAERELEQVRPIVEQQRNQLAGMEEKVRTLDRRVAEATELLGRIRASYVSRALRAAGLWRWLDADQRPALPSRQVTLNRIVVDLTPVLPGGENGGAKPLAIELMRHLAAIARSCEFIVLTSEQSDQELSVLDAPNLRRVCVTKPGAAFSTADRAAIRSRRWLARFLPESVLAKLGGVYREATSLIPVRSGLLRQLRADLLFCPFTSPFFLDPAIPVVCLVHDLQYLYYPQFFPPSARAERDRHFRRACAVAARVVCVSEYVRSTVLENGNIPADHVTVVHTVPQNRLPVPSPRTVRGTLEQLRLAARRYLLYPANFWAHKNHELLLAAFGMYRAAHPQSDLVLVLTGAPGPRRTELMADASAMGLKPWIRFPGYLPEESFAALLRNANAMIFPSLFEGFGMPILEAMAAGVPVLASTSTSLPEVAGDAALLFDAKRPVEIVQAIERLETDAALRRELVAKGSRHAKSFGGPRDMAARYWAVFQQAITVPARLEPGVYGVYGDAWMSSRAVVVFAALPAPHSLEMEIEAPAHLPHDGLTVSVLVGSREPAIHHLSRGRTVKITVPLPAEPGCVELLCSPVFQPDACGMGDDARQLACRLLSAAIAGPDGNAVALKTELHAD